MSGNGWVEWMAENAIWKEFRGTMRAWRHEPATDPPPDLGHFGILDVVPEGLRLPCRGRVRGLGSGVGRAEDERCGSGLATLPRLLD